MSNSNLRNQKVNAGAVKNYFDKGNGGTAGAISMMAHEHNLPVSAASYRIRKELRTINAWLTEVPASGSVLDVGCGAGAWTAIFAHRYKAIVGIEQSILMYKAAKERLAHLPHVKILEGNCLDGLPEGSFDMIFLGGLCMYLNDQDVIDLLNVLKARLNKGGAIILRESTVPKGEYIAKGEYQAVYRNVNLYHQLFNEAGPFHTEVQRNFGYTNLVTAEELVIQRRKWLPFLSKDSRTLGSLTWWSLRITAPLSFWLLPKMLSKLGVQWPRLQNHFFRLQLKE